MRTRSFARISWSSVCQCLSSICSNSFQQSVVPYAVSCTWYLGAQSILRIQSAVGVHAAGIHRIGRMGSDTVAAGTALAAPAEVGIATGPGTAVPHGGWCT